MDLDNKISNKSVETYADDMAEVIENSEGGMIKKIIHEQEAKEAEKEGSNPESKRNKVFMLVSLLLIMLAFIVLGYFAVFRETINTVPVELQFVPIIFSDKTQFLDVGGFKKDEIQASVWNEFNTTEIKEKGLESVYLIDNKQVIGFKKLNTLIESNIPESLLPFINDNFLIGVLNNKETKDLFMLLSVRSFTDVFPGMLSWEKKMLFDLHGFFGVDINPDTNYLYTKDFEDGVVENKNARILYDNNRNIVIMYVYANDTSLIITNTQTAAHEAMVRISGSQIRK